MVCDTAPPAAYLGLHRHAAGARDRRSLRRADPRRAAALREVVAAMVLTLGGVTLNEVGSAQDFFRLFTNPPRISFTRAGGTRAVMSIRIMSCP